LRVKLNLRHHTAPPPTDTNPAPSTPLAPPQVVVAEDYECLRNNGVEKENSMRSLPNIRRLINVFQTPTLNNSDQISQNTPPVTTTNSITPALKIVPKSPFSKPKIASETVDAPPTPTKLIT
jgi:hypothetical protein